METMQKLQGCQEFKNIIADVHHKSNVDTLKATN